MPLVNALLGAVLLSFGRSLYWAFVALAGFLVGVQLTDVVLADQSQVLRVLVAVVAGVLGALLAMLAQRVGFALGGLYAGGYLALSLASAAGSNDDDHLLWFTIGGVIGAIVAVFLMDWAVIVLSSLVGAAAIVVTLGLAPIMSAILFVVLAAAGITVQGNRLQPRTAVHKPPS